MALCGDGNRCRSSCRGLGVTLLLSCCMLIKTQPTVLKARKLKDTSTFGKQDIILHLTCAGTVVKSDVHKGKVCGPGFREPNDPCTPASIDSLRWFWSVALLHNLGPLPRNTKKMPARTVRWASSSPSTCLRAWKRRSWRCSPSTA